MLKENGVRFTIKATENYAFYCMATGNRRKAIIYRTHDIDLPGYAFSLYVNGLLAREGKNQDYLLSKKTITILAYPIVVSFDDTINIQYVQDGNLIQKDIDPSDFSKKTKKSFRTKNFKECKTCHYSDICELRKKK